MTSQPQNRRFSALAVALAASLFAASAAGQWAWKDDTGRMVYSNQPPPANVKAGQIVRQPGIAPAARSSGPTYGEPDKPAAAGSTAAGPAAGAATAAPAATASNAPKTFAERDAEFRKRQQERAEADRKAQEDQQRTAQRAAECERARGYLRALEEGMRITRTDPAGNQEFLDDAQRAAEIDRTRKAVAEFCK